MTSSMMLSRTAAAGAIALAATAAAVQVTATAALAAIRCPVGYLCLQPADAPSSRLFLVKEGDKGEFRAA